MKKILIGILMVFILVSCAPAATVTPTLPPSPTVGATLPGPATATQPPSPEPDRYVNEEGGFSLELPEGWTVIGPIEVNNSLDRPYNLYLLGTDPNPNSGPGASRIVIANAALWTPEDYISSQCSTCPAHPFEDINLGGRPARRTQIGGGEVPLMVTWTFFEIDGQLIALAIHDPESLQPLDEVLESIRF